jgi:Concanavalin A-like lectin/glucanases superfamily
MALAFVAASSQYLSQASALATAATIPNGFVCWYSPINSSNEQTLIGIGATSLTNFLDMEVNTGGLARGLQSQVGQASLVPMSVADVALSPSWNHVAVVFSSATTCTVWLNGVSAVVSGASNLPPGLSVTTIGALMHGGTVINFANGAIAYPGIWMNYAPTPGDISTLYNGGSGFDPRKLSNPPNASFSTLQTAIAPLDSVSGQNWTVNGSPTFVPDPFSLTGVAVPGGSFPIVQGSGIEPGGGLGAQLAAMTHRSMGGTIIIRGR